MKKIILILDNIRSVHNVGSLFRTADGFGISEIFLCGTTPTPIDRFGRKRSDFHKVSLGAEQTIAWKYFETTQQALSDARVNHYHIVAIEQDKNSHMIDTFVSEKNIAILLGTEVTGMSQDILDMSDTILEIPMKGTKESFNVSVAGAIAMYELSKNKKTA